MIVAISEVGRPCGGDAAVGATRDSPVHSGMVMQPPHALHVVRTLHDCGPMRVLQSTDYPSAARALAAVNKTALLFGEKASGPPLCFALRARLAWLMAEPCIAYVLLSPQVLESQAAATQ
jgi:hypothetical protein